MSLLTLAQNAADRIGISRPTSVVGSTDQQSLRLLGYAQQEGKDLARKYPWQILTKEQTFTSTATAEQTSALPTNFDRFVDETFFNRTRKRPVFGPLTPEEWQFAQTMAASVIVESFRQRGGSILITPTPTAGDTYAFEYQSKNWCQSSGGTGQSAWAADTDTGILEEELMTLGLVWRFKRGIGTDYSEDFRTYETQCAQAFGRDGGRRTLNVKRPRVRVGPYIQEGSWSL